MPSPDFLNYFLTYTVNIVGDQTKDVADATFMNESKAITHAEKMAEEAGFYTPVAIWDESGEPIWIFILGETFKRV